MKKFRNKETGNVIGIPAWTRLYIPEHWEELPADPQPCWWYKCTSPKDVGEWRKMPGEPILACELCQKHFGPTPPQDDTSTGSKFSGVTPDRFLIDEARHIAPVTTPIPYNEFDFRHLRGCPQSVFRPGDRCSCNVIYHNLDNPVKPTTAEWRKTWMKEYGCMASDTTRIDLDWD